jgi:hypothetical protein
LTTGATFVDVFSDELPGLGLAAVTSSAASAADASASAASAALSASLVGAPADTAVAAIVGNPASATRVALAPVYERARWHSIVDPRYNPGGSTGTAAQNDIGIAAAIAAAVDHATPGRTVYIPDGYFAHSQQIDLTGVQGISIVGASHSRSAISNLNWIGADNVSQILITNASGVVISGIGLNAGAGFGALISGTQQRAAHIDARAVPGQTAQATNIVIEGCFFSQDGTLPFAQAGYTGDGTEFTGGNCVDIATGYGHTWSILRNDFKGSAIAIEGSDNTVSPAQGTQTCLIQGNLFEPVRRIAHITDPGADWNIVSNSVEPLYNCTAGFIKFVKATTSPNVRVDSNWCGDVSFLSVTGSQIEIAGGPYTITNNLLGMGIAGTAGIRCTGALTGGATNGTFIQGNRFFGDTNSVCIDYGAFTHTAYVYDISNSINASSMVGASGTLPPKLIENKDLTATSLGVTVPIVAGVVDIDARVRRQGVYLYLTAAVTAMNVTNPADGQRLTLSIRQSGTVYAFAWPTSFHFAGTAPACNVAYAMTNVVMLYDLVATRWTEVSRAVNIA